MYEAIERKYKAVNSLAQKTGDTEIITLSEFLWDRIRQPDSFVTMLGETSSGKTTLINGILGGNYLYTSVQPSTGAIVEVEFTSAKPEHRHYAILKDAKMAKLTEDEFVAQSKAPADYIKRLLLRIPSPDFGRNKLRLFDTPGYGSIIDRHEEILVDFLPESNLIVYVVAYKVGIQQDDYEFIRYISEIITPDTEFVLAINRVPEQIDIKDSRIAEIRRYVSDLLHYTPETFLIPNAEKEIDGYPIPECGRLWSHIKENIMSEEHQRLLEKSFEGYVFGLFNRCEENITKRALALLLNQHERDELIAALRKEIGNIEAAKTRLVRPAFADLTKSIPLKLDKSRGLIVQAVFAKIDGSAIAHKEETITFVNSHMLQFETKKQMDEIRLYVEAKLNELDRELKDLLNKSMQEIERVIEVHFSIERAKMAKSFIKKYAGNALEQSLLSYFKQFAGRGGTGIANGAKHLLKKVGDFFGKTFSRETHNKLAHILSKIGATSARAVGIAVVAVLEVLFLAVDAATWKPLLKKKVEEGINKWYDVVVEEYKGEFDKLEEENLKLLNEFIGEYQESIEAFGGEKDDDIQVLQKLCEEVKAEIGAYSYD